MESVVKQLKELGLSTYEAKAYTGLVKSQALTGYELSKRCGVPMSKIYETLSKLENSGLVCPISENPTQYVPLPPNEFINRLTKEFKDKAAILKKSFYELSDQTELVPVWNISGMENILLKASNLIKNTQRSIYLSIWPEEYEKLYKILNQSASNGVTINVLGHGKIEPVIGNYFHHEFEQSVIADRGREIVLVAEESEVLVGCVSGELPHAVWTQNKSLVMVIREFVMHEIDLWRVVNEVENLNGPLRKSDILDLLQKGVENK